MKGLAVIYFWRLHSAQCTNQQDVKFAQPLLANMHTLLNTASFVSGDTNYLVFRF